VERAKTGSHDQHRRLGRSDVSVRVPLVWDAGGFALGACGEGRRELVKAVVLRRYKMPRLEARIEGRGNGIRTNVVNMKDIAEALARSPAHTTKVGVAGA
jgi:translation initiation factor 2 beta subunit (eIF-2beta)/eIF-5